jgi:multiple sugar transport system substrate-binding protein
MLDRRRVLAVAAGLAAAGLLSREGLAAVLRQTDKTGVDPSKWNADTIRQMAGTRQTDTAAEVHAVVPQDVSGELLYWNVGPNQASPDIDRTIYDEFLAAFPTYYPNITLDNQNQDYNGMLDKLRTACRRRRRAGRRQDADPVGVEFAARGQLQEVTLEEFGFTAENFWPGAIKSVTWDGKLYGVPTNNETMAFIWNRQIFEQAGLDPESPPATWADVVEYSRIIKEETGKNGYGMVAKVNAGNTPFRFMPMLWAYGSGALDEAEPEPRYEASMLNNEGGIAALQAMYDMYVTDRSVPTSALTNTQTENQDLFIAGEIAMVISHPSEYALMSDRAARATGSDKERADAIVANMAYGLIPEGPVRRAVVFGGSNIHIMTDEAAGHAVSRDAARALITTLTHPEWSTKFAWTGSNPGNLQGFETEWMKQRLDEIKFLEMTSSMLPYGVPFPVVPESTEIMNIIVPEMLQNALTQSMTVEEAANDAAEKVNALMAAR